jgi:1-acyl-sn-glycerol-3-phosphate acyltransferase
LLSDFIIKKHDAVSIITILKTRGVDKEEIYSSFADRSDILLFDKQYITNRLVDIVRSDFMSIAIMTSLLVFVVLLLTYGRIELALVAFIPMFVTWIWILGLMSFFDIRFNIINIIISALIFGLGDDYSLFIMEGLVQEYKTGRKNLSSFKSSIFLSAVTIVVGLGVLIFAKHPALHSIAVISIIGIACVVMISTVLIPFLFNILITRRTGRKLFPWTFLSIFKSVFAYAYFAFGCLLLLPIGVFLLKLGLFNKEKGKLIYHKVISRFAWSMIYIMGNVRKKVIKDLREDFSKPAIVICNHQSVLDILVTIMLSPRLILLTNNWVWNSPVFGFVVRMAEYYPVARGIENSIELLENRIKQGYSIVIFPEGTRSIDGKIHRFHKGAFYLAEKLQLDILPVLIHGTGYTMSKNDLLLKDGSITIKYLPRIHTGDNKFGEDYSERAKYIGRYFRQEYEMLKMEIEQPSYFKEELFYNYIYKGPVLEWYEKVKLRLEKYYKPIHDLLPKKGRFLDIGCGFGFMSFMLNFSAREREITGIDYDQNKIDTANNCIGKNENVNFIHADIMEYNFEKYNAIILSDVLHYLLPGEQRNIIIKSIQNLLPGGTVLIRDGNADLIKRHRGTKISEMFSTTILGFNKTKPQGLSFLSSSLVRETAKEMNVSYSEIDHTKLTSNIIYVLKKDEDIK